MTTHDTGSSYEVPYVGPDSTTIRVEDRVETITLVDGEAIQAAVAERLKHWKHEFRDLLLSRLGDPSIMPGGVLMLGLWRLDSRQGRLDLSQTILTAASARVIAHVYVFRVSNGWSAGDFKIETVHRGRVE